MPAFFASLGQFEQQVECRAGGVLNLRAAFVLSLTLAKGDSIGLVVPQMAGVPGGKGVKCQKPLQSPFETFGRFQITRLFPVVHQVFGQPHRILFIFRQMDGPYPLGRFFVFFFWQFVQNIAYFVQPAELPFCLMPNFGQCRPRTPGRHRATAIAGSFTPLAFRSLSKSSQLCFDSR